MVRRDCSTLSLLASFVVLLDGAGAKPRNSENLPFARLASISKVEQPATLDQGTSLPNVGLSSAAFLASQQSYARRPEERLKSLGNFMGTLGCPWAPNASHVSCQLMDPYPSAPPEHSADFKPEEAEDFCDSIGPKCGGFLFVTKEAAKARNPLAHPIASAYYCTNGTFVRGRQHQYSAIGYSRACDGAKAVGVTVNTKGDLDAFLAASVINIAMSVVCIVVFMVVRKWYPLTFSNNVLEGFAPLTSQALTEPEECMFGWAAAAWGVTTDEVAESISLDHAMLLEFPRLCMRILLIAGVPTVCVLAPLHLFFGGSASHDQLSVFSMGNVENGSWLYWIHAFAVWGVVVTVHANIYQAQKMFLPRRSKWLHELPEPRRSTVLVEGIPDEYQSDAALKQFFGKLFGPDRVGSAYVVRKVGALAAAQAQKEASAQGLREAQAMFAKNGEIKYKEKATSHEQNIEKAESDIQRELADIKSGLSKCGGVHGRSGFVTFVERKDALIAQNFEYGEGTDGLQVSRAPPPQTVIWDDLLKEPLARKAHRVIGYSLVAGLYAAYLPLIFLITTIATHIDMGDWGFPYLQPLWAGLAPTVGLQFMMGFLPTFLLLIFNLFFILKDSSWAQASLQNWYFLFQVVFVILVTAVGSTGVAFAKRLLLNPAGVFHLLADTLPFATHFFMNFLLLQWASHFVNIVRAAPLGKFVLFSWMYDEKEAWNMAEPEDQDYYGMGSRSARWTATMCIGIIFGTLSPPIYVLTFVNFAICRLVYGYLIPFAESKKPDLGGRFWVQQLKHVLLGTAIYCVVMIGVLYGRAATSGPCLICAPSLVFVIWSYVRFESALPWEEVPIKELVDAPRSARKPPFGHYVQPELID